MTVLRVYLFSLLTLAGIFTHVRSAAQSQTSAQTHTSVQSQTTAHTQSLAQVRPPSPVPPKERLILLLDKHRNHILNDTAYLKAVDSVVFLTSVLADDSLASLLVPYQEIAFGNSVLGAYRAKYYTYLAYNSINNKKYGSAIYYSEKNNEERVKTGQFEKGGIPHSDMFAITIYYNNRDYARVFARYAALRPVLMALPAAIPAGKVSAEQAYMAFSIMNSVVFASYKAGDTTFAHEGIGICDRMMDAIRKLPAKYNPGYLNLYNYVYYSLYYSREKYLGHFGPASDFLQMAIREVRSPTYPVRLQPEYAESIYTEAFNFYFDYGRSDSARHYRDLALGLSDSLVKLTVEKQSFLLESNSKLQSRGGHFEDAYRNLWKLYQMSDSAFYAVSSDKDNNLYALADAENAQHELLRAQSAKALAEEARSKMERFSIFLYLLITFLVLAGAIIFAGYRSLQRQRLLNLRLDLARNFHDDIGPMLLYAHSLIKKESESNQSEWVQKMKVQMTYIMEAVRGISHDLKSGELYTVSTFCREIISLLEKIKAATEIDFSIRSDNESPVLSHFQYSNLMKIMNELISNSVKHARCKLISIQVHVNGRKLFLKYSDDGQGIEPEKLAGGIGMQNMKERAELLNGEFKWSNSWPQGYIMDVSIPIL